MYPHMSIPRHIPPPPGYPQNIIPNVPVGINQHPLHFQQPIFRQNAYQQHIHHSANYQPIQRENRNNMPPRARPAECNRSSERQPDNRDKHHNRSNHVTSQIPRFHSVNMHQYSVQASKNQSSQKCPIVYPSNAQEAQVKTNCINYLSGIPLFVSPGDIPCNKTSANVNLQENQQQALPTSNCSPRDDTYTTETMQNCPSTPVRATSHQANSDKSFLGVDQINPPPDPSIIRIS
ncbi:unnamed protein product [Mytilus coruscus]|uniref:Uncharacterized protein n=1 Tax=Mytilus coruscus TaxID=42192 RepID=A0A6J7ZY23_MYTCO|nr:unnamed protein product [Mytilus coruscus]